MPRFNYQITILNQLPQKVVKEEQQYTLKKTLNYKLRKDVKIYKPNQLESTSIEIIQSKETFIAGCIYRYPSMETSDFNKYYL